MEEPRNYDTKGSKSEKDKYMISLICGIFKKWYKWTCLQNRNRLADIESKLMVTKGESEERGINQDLVNNKEISPEYTLEGLMLKLKLQYSGPLMWRADSLEKTLILGKIEGRRRRANRGWDGWMASPTQWTKVWVTSGSWWWTGRPGVLQSMGLHRVGHDWATELK